MMKIELRAAWLAKADHRRRPPLKRLTTDAARRRSKTICWRDAAGSSEFVKETSFVATTLRTEKAPRRQRR